MPAAKGRVFVVEDHPATARGLKTYLELCGYSVEIASDIASAMKVAQADSFDVLLCDLNLPDGTGWELMQRLLKQRPIRGIAFSAYDEPAQIERSKAAGFVDHVVKGGAPEDLVAVIERTIASRRSAEGVKRCRDRAPKRAVERDDGAVI